MELISNVIKTKEKSVRDVFRILDGLVVKVVFFLEGEKLSGVVSEGDIRRFILNDGDLDCGVDLIATKKPIIAYSIKEAKTILNKKRSLKAIPIIDNEGRLKDIYCLQEFTYNKLGIPVVINAGGRGKRLDPYTNILPKPLIPVGDVPVIELIMNEFEKYQCCKFYVIVNYKRQMIKAYFSDAGRKHLITWLDEDKPLGTGGGVRLVRKSMSETFFLMNCDTLIKTDYSCILEQHKREKNCVTVVCAYKNIRIPYGVIETREGGQINTIREKPEMSFLTNAGMYVVEPEVLDEIGDCERIDFTDVLERIMRKGMKVGVYPISEIEWLDMGQPEELERMKKILEGNIGSTQ